MDGRLRLLPTAALMPETPSRPTPIPPPFLYRRFMVLARKEPEAAQALHDQMDRDIHLRHERLVAMSKKPVVVEAPEEPTAQ